MPDDKPMPPSKTTQFFAPVLSEKQITQLQPRPGERITDYMDRVAPVYLSVLPTLVNDPRMKPDKAAKVLVDLIKAAIPDRQLIDLHASRDPLNDLSDKELDDYIRSHLKNEPGSKDTTEPDEG